jgi:hypothetical protein
MCMIFGSAGISSGIYLALLKNQAAEIRASGAAGVEDRED